MDSSGRETPCKNSSHGCTFASSSIVDMVKHFQNDCMFHLLRCFKCNRTVRKINFGKHYMQSCKDSTAPPRPAPEEVPDVQETKAKTTIELQFLQECVKECTSGVDSLCRIMKDVAADVAEVKVVKDKQQDLEVIVKEQGDLIDEVKKSVTMNAEKVNKVQEDVDGLVREVGTLTRRLADQSKVHWYVENVSQYIEKAKTEESEVQSDAFLVRGYSAKLWFKVKKVEGDLCVALFFCLCRGPNDSLLQWPFRIPYTLSLIHPNDASRSRHFKITPPSTGAEYFKKRKDDVIKGYGAPRFCTVEVVQNEGFIEDDAVCFSLTLHE